MDSLDMFWRDNPKLAARPNKKPSTYTIAFQPLAASAVQTQNSINVAGDFVCLRITGVQTTSGTNVAYITLPLILQLVITAINLNFNNVKTEWSTSGISVSPQAANIPVDLPYPFFLPNATTVTAILDNPAPTAANVWISFIGIQVNP